MALFIGVQYLCTFNIVAPLTHDLLPNVSKMSETIRAFIFVDVLYWPPYTTDKSISCVIPGSSQWFIHFGEEIVIAGYLEKVTTLGGREPHNFPWQCKESQSCCHGPLALLQMEDSGISTVLTRYESMRLRSICQIERTTARDQVQQKRWIYTCYNAVNLAPQQSWTHW